MLLQYFHQTASAKVLAVKQYVMDALEAGRKFLLFAHHQEMLNPLEDAVSKVGTLLLSTIQSNLQFTASILDSHFVFTARV